jgi:hypothetical protein
VVEEVTERQRGRIFACCGCVALLNAELAFNPPAAATRPARARRLAR